MKLQGMIEELIEQGVKQAEIAREAETSPAIITYVSQGRTPRYDIGKRIEEAHKRIMRSAKRKQAKESQK